VIGSAEVKTARWAFGGSPGGSNQEAGVTAAKKRSVYAFWFATSFSVKEKYAAVISSAVGRSLETGTSGSLTASGRLGRYEVKVETASRDAS
jgi:hypothetical protein